MNRHCAALFPRSLSIAIRPVCRVTNQPTDAVRISAIRAAFSFSFNISLALYLSPGNTIFVLMNSRGFLVRRDRLIRIPGANPEKVPRLVGNKSNMELSSNKSKLDCQRSYLENNLQVAMRLYLGTIAFEIHEGKF